MKRPGRAALEWAALALPALAVLAAVGWLPTRRMAGPGSLAALGAGLGIGGAASALAALPVLFALAAETPPKPQATVGWAMALRFLGTLAGTASVALGTDLPRVPLVVWVMLAYFVLLVVETRWAARWLRPA